ncbi:MAG: alpha/beta hydrolase [Neptuniibacter caesariensis]|uniref:Alpha/beta hydrolase n=1 Tax=Neptuniibacter caesariensis TaxID=207954 RepID=A0A2G6JB69_NEPCE|nr:MAG: alpha/beta hydrolase [Neptuniibacter caesariensis]
MSSASRKKVVKIQPEPALHKVLGFGPDGYHEVAYTEWGKPDPQRTVICAHGLTRNARDFDKLARKLSVDHHVLCPDVVGRGASDWLADHRHYTLDQFASDQRQVIARSGANSVDWIGTSMGGLIGIMLASDKRSPIRRMIINDIGPLIPAVAIRRIKDYLCVDPVFDSLDDAEKYIREVYVQTHPMTDADWKHYAEHGVRLDEQGKYRLHNDPKIGETIKRYWAFVHVNLWSRWNKIECPVLVIRGEKSDFLTEEIAEKMAKTGPKADVITIPDVGHHPSLQSAEQIAMVTDWLDENAI